MHTSSKQNGKAGHQQKTVAKTVTSSVENKKRSEIIIAVKEKAVVFFIGGAGDKESYYFTGPYHNIREAQDIFDPKMKDLAKRNLYSSYYLSYADAKGDDDIQNKVLKNIPNKKTPVYIVGHSLGGWNGAHLSGILSNRGFDVEMLVTLDPVGEGALVYTGSDIYRTAPHPAAKFWINIRATPKKPDQSDSVAEFGERWTVHQGPTLNYIADVNHYNARKMFLAPLKDKKSAADLMYDSIWKLTN